LNLELSAAEYSTLTAELTSHRILYKVFRCDYTKLSSISRLNYIIIMSLTLPSQDYDLCCRCLRIFEIITKNARCMKLQ